MYTTFGGGVCASASETLCTLLRELQGCKGCLSGCWPMSVASCDNANAGADCGGFEKADLLILQAL